MRKILEFMQRHDHNGDWLNWLREIESGEAEFDVDYVRNVLQSWYDDSGEAVYLEQIERVNAL